MYEHQQKKHMAEFCSCLYELYGSRWDFYSILNRAEKILHDSWKERSNELKQIDKSYIQSQENGGTPWFLDNNAVGMMLYVDLFSDNLLNLKEKIPYLKECGVNYVHLMPLFKSPEKENDGGYAVSNYREVEPRLGTIKQLEQIAADFRKEGIHLVIDFVFNHTSFEHEWAKKAIAGEQKYRDFYFIYKDKKDADEWNKTLREIFPSVRRGSFTYFEKAGGWVWTTFNSFQWDLNYSNPEVFLAMCQEMLFLANLGVEVLRLDALAFVWKEKGTCCENLDKAHTLIKAFDLAAKIACPGVIFKSEAIVHPDCVVKYIAKNQCELSYNPLQMALFWSSLASRDARLLTLSLKKRMYIPDGCAWVNYIRCHDDIGWTFSDEDAASIGINAFEHRKFLNSFYTGRFEGSFASGEPFQENPDTGDCRICGTMASLAGLEQAEKLNNDLYRKMACARIKMMYGALLALPGLPLLYAGDERAYLNDYSYRNVPEKKDDSRWVHRIKTDWSLSNELDSQKEIAAQIKKMILARKKTAALSGSRIWFYDTQYDIDGRQKSGVFAFCRSDKIHVIANFSEREEDFTVYGRSRRAVDILSGKEYDLTKPVHLKSYDILWLSEE